MRYKVLLTAGAESDLDEIHNYVAERDSFSRANHVLDELMPEIRWMLFNLLKITGGRYQPMS